MNVGRFALVVGSVAAVTCFATIGPVLAMPAQSVSALVTAAPSFKLEPVGCNCVRRVHRRRYVRRYEPDYAVPVYPAPPVGLTFRKLFDAGLL